jgi:hypothetical protein
VKLPLDALEEVSTWRILRGHTQSSLLKRRDEEMVQTSQRCGETVLNYNRPKVLAIFCQVAIAPHASDRDECSWLFAGKPGGSGGTRLCHTPSIGS